MSGKVNSLVASGSTPLSRAGAAQDKFVETLGDVVMRKLAGILEDDNAESIARVSAGKVILEWIRPKKGNQVAIQINTAGAHVSHLDLPAPQQKPIDTQAVVEAPSEYPKVLPEPGTPMQAGKLSTPATAFEALRELQADRFDRPEALVPRSPTPRTPDKPEAAASVKQFR